eukprot:18952-Heterococcus_DN1.PRE.2
MLAPADSWGATGTTETPALTDTGIRAISYDGDDFTEEGFASLIEYLYTGAVASVTCGTLDCDKLQATLQAAQYFNLDSLDTAARKWAERSGVAIESQGG